MNITAVIVTCIAAALLCLYLRQSRPEFAALVSLACSILVLIFVVQGISKVAAELESLIKSTQLDTEMLGIVLKCLGICILAELGSGSCRDAGETAIATKVELAAKLSLILASLPLFTQLFGIAGKLLKL